MSEDLSLIPYGCTSCQTSTLINPLLEVPKEDCCSIPDLYLSIWGNDLNKHRLTLSEFWGYYNNKFITFDDVKGWRWNVFEERKENLKESQEIKKTVKPSKEIFLKTKEIFDKYLDTSELNYNLIVAWTLGTHFHHKFETFPLITIMARKQSGKSRTLKLISALSDGSDGSISTSITETQLFRHKKGAMFFDEMESISSKEKGAMRETINAVYKRGNKIIRYFEKKTPEGRQYVEECFYPFYPLGLANIYGFGDVLADRSIQIILQRSAKSQTKLIEDFSTNEEILELKKQLAQLDVEIPKGIFTEWNSYIKTGQINEDLRELFEKISETQLSGRPLELFFPLFLVAKNFGVLNKLIECSKEYMEQQEGEFVDSIDDLLHNYMESANYKGYVNLSKILNDFRSSLESPEEWVNSKWLGRALKRLGLIDKKRHINGHVQVILKVNTTNSINSTKSTNTTNSTNNEKQVELVENVELFNPKEVQE